MTREQREALGRTTDTVADLTIERDRLKEELESAKLDAKKYSRELDASAEILQRETEMGRAGQGVGILCVSEFVRQLVADRDRWKAAAERLVGLYRSERNVRSAFRADYECFDRKTDESIAAALAGTEGEEQTETAKEAGTLTEEEREVVQRWRRNSLVDCSKLLAIIDRLTGGTPT